MWSRSPEGTPADHRGRMAQSAPVRRLSTPVYFAILALVVVPLVALAFLGGSFGGSPASPVASPPAAASGGAAAGGSSGPAGSAGASQPAASPGDSGPPPTPLPAAEVPIVPVVDFRSTVIGITADDVRAVLAGASRRWTHLELIKADANGILAALQVSRPVGDTRLVTVSSTATLARDLAAHSDRLGFLRAAQVTPAVRAIAWQGRSLFGVGRVKSTADWKLTSRLPGDRVKFDAGKTWTLVAGGDILLDRGVAKQVKVLGKGVDFPFSGGTAEITARHCCSSFAWPIPTTRRTGHAGAIRALLSGADIAVANFENPAPNSFRYHTQGTVFSADPRLIEGLANAGIDVVSIANNHIGDAGRLGVTQTIANLDKYGLEHAGAGKNATAAHAPAILRAGGLRVAILGYDTIAGYYTAGSASAGSARLTAAGVKADVARARRAGANLVIVYPHWGTEYRASPFPAQQKLARAIIDAGADMVIGNHAHWVGAMEVYKGKPIWYALGNFVFDQTWSEPTMEGLILELTFRGKDLVQVRLHPTIILDGAQPNFLDPAGDGRVVLGQLYDASKKLLPW
jgi:hypothetical protein